ncbi:hypothetical protein FOA52_008660 [Chlamydomonas sp. UWO 241]|nr:hypothetical protein FOA52_008660 [Chlamydomonas sp. UWO 241]
MALVVAPGGGGGGAGGAAVEPDVDKVIQKAVGRRTIDFTAPYIHYLGARLTSPFTADHGQLLPTFGDALRLLPPHAYAHTPAASLPSKIAHATWGRARSSINAAAWTPDGRRLVLGAGNGEFSLWGATNLSFESAMQVHTAAVRSIVYTHNQQFVISTDDAGFAKIFKPNFELMVALQAHRDPVRSVAFSPTDVKFCTGSDDSTIHVS